MEIPTNYGNELPGASRGTLPSLAITRLSLLQFT